MRNVFAFAIGVVVASTGVAIAADPPYVGTWKLNAAKSQLTGDILSIEKTSSGMHYDVNGFAYDFNLDGKEYPLPDGGTTSWTAVDAKTWQVTNRRNGKISGAYRLVVDRDTLLVESKWSKANGGTLDESSRATRMSGGPGFVGRWRISAVTKPAVTTMNIASDGVDGVSLTSSDDGSVCKAKFDGRDSPVTGPFVGTGRTCALKTKGPRAFEDVEKLNGKPTDIGTFSVSEDGKTLTFDSTAKGSRPPARVIYDRQQ